METKKTIGGILKYSCWVACFISLAISFSSGLPLNMKIFWLIVLFSIAIPLTILGCRLE